MADPKGTPPRWPAEPTAPAAKPATSAPAPDKAKGAGRIVHDARGNAVWDWVKETGRVCIESTSAILKRLEVPGLKVEGDKDEEKDELRLESERDAGGGYNPYGGYNPTEKKPVPKAKPPGKK
jgi:hypothetical protein